MFHFLSCEYPFVNYCPKFVKEMSEDTFWVPSLIFGVPWVKLWGTIIVGKDSYLQIFLHSCFETSNSVNVRVYTAVFLFFMKCFWDTFSGMLIWLACLSLCSVVSSCPSMSVKSYKLFHGILWLRWRINSFKIFETFHACILEIHLLD